MQNRTKNRSECSEDDHVEIMVNREQEPLISRQLRTHKYKRRYYILFVYSFYSWFCCVQWNSYGPIVDSITTAFPDWNSSTIAIMENWIVVMYLVCIIPIMWFVYKFGLRTAILLASLLMTFGLSLRCISDKYPLFTVMCHVSAAMIGITATLILATPTMLTAVWFPQNERTTATAIIMGASSLGNVGSYLEPLFIRQPSADVPNSLIRKDIMSYFYVCAGIACIILAAVIVYFPSKPPLPPSVTSASERLNFKEGITSIVRNKNFLIYLIGYGIGIGPMIGFTGVLNLSLAPLGYTQNQSMIIAQIGIITSVILTLVVGCLTDRLYGYMKGTIIVMLLGTAVSYYWLLLIISGFIAPQNWQICLSITIGLSLGHSTIALFFELGSEIAYPVSEVIVGGLLTGADSLFTAFFLLCYSFKNLGFEWVPYVLVISNALSVIIIMAVKDDYTRSNIDRPEYTSIDP